MRSHGGADDEIQFLSIPFQTYEPDPNRLELAPEAEQIWTKLREDRRLDRRQSLGVTTAAQDPDGQPRPSEAASPTKGATKPPTKREQALAAARAESAAENGLCT